MNSRSLSSKSLIPRLLSGKNRLSRSEKDAILASVLGQVAPERRPTWSHPGVWAATASALALLVIVPVAMRGGQSDAPDRSFTARGKASAIAAFDLACQDSQHQACHPGDRLVFDLHKSAEYLFFAAFAKRDDGTVIWYFPESPTSRSLDLRDRMSDGVLDRSVILESEHAPGHYRVYGVFSLEPLSRSDIKSRFQEGADDLGPGTALTTRELVVE